MRPAFPVAALLCVSLNSLPAAAHAQDTDLMVKWTNFTIVRYVVVGEYAGDVRELAGTHVTDRVEITFDWNQNETALVGTPTIKNSPSNVATPKPQGECPAPRLNGPYDQWNVESANQTSNTLRLSGPRKIPAGMFPSMATGACELANGPARTEPVEIMLVVVPAMMFGMPQALGEGMSISKDGKSIVYADREHSGWTWTYTPTGIR